MVERLDCRTLYRTIDERARARATFIDWPANSYGYASLKSDVQKCCALFDLRGLIRRSCILIITRNERVSISLFVAALLDGYVPIMLTPETPYVRAKAIFELTRPTLIVADQDWLIDQNWILDETILAVPAASATSSRILGNPRRMGRPRDDFITVSQTLEGRQPSCVSRADDLAYVLFTSGTTSAPKGVMITHRNLFSHLETLLRVFGYDASSAIFNGMVLAHADGLVQGPLLSLASGGRLIRPPAFLAQELDQYLNMVRAKSATHFITVPTVYSLIERYAQHRDYFEAKEFVALISVAAKLEENLWRRLQDKFNRPVYNMYGLTETVTSALYAGPGSDLGPIGTIGKPIDMEIRLVGMDGHDVADGEAGEIWLRGENVSPGYFADSVATADRYDDDWLKTGDLAIRRPDASYVICGRAKAAVMSGGFLINPEELDEVLLSHPAIVEAVSVGIPDDNFGEIVISSVVLDKVASEIELTEYCRHFLEPRKVPKRIFAVQAIPRGDAGKPRLEELRQLVSKKMATEQSRPASSDLAGKIIEIASHTFRVPSSTLTLESTPRTVARWDSFAHINLVLNVEKQLKKRIATAEALQIDSLRKLLEVVSRN